MHVFTEPKMQAKMDDNSSIVALSHILDRHIICYCFPLLLLSCLSVKLIFLQNLLHNQRSGNNLMLESDCRVEECYITRLQEICKSECSGTHVNADLMWYSCRKYVGLHESFPAAETMGQ